MTPTGARTHNSRQTGRYRAQVAEVINRNQVISLAMARGFNAFLPAYDGGIDFILYHEEHNTLFRVQLKSRWTIDAKYTGRDIWIAFPMNDAWYLMDHDRMMLPVGEAMGFTASRSWLEGGKYTVPGPTRALLDACAKGRFDEASAMAGPTIVPPTDAGVGHP